jgi:hypothetical protein
MSPFEEAAFLTQMKELNGYRNLRPLPGGRWAGIMQFMFTDAIIVGRMGNFETYDDRWCYERGKADVALEGWDGTGEPEGWHRHPDSGRRREKGDPATEYVNP